MPRSSLLTSLVTCRFADGLAQTSDFMNNNNNVVIRKITRRPFKSIRVESQQYSDDKQLDNQQTQE